jgi:thiamine biosynthesis protein ThiS
MTPAEIHITVNGFSESVPAEASLAELIVRFKEGDADLIVELNGRFVYPRQYAATRIQAGDRLEFINPNFGG